MTIRRGGRLEDMMALGSPWSMSLFVPAWRASRHRSLLVLASLLRQPCSILSQSTFTGAFRFSPLFHILRTLPAAESATNSSFPQITSSISPQVHLNSHEHANFFPLKFLCN